MMPPSLERKDFYKRFLSSVATHLFALFIGLVGSIILARGLGPETRGIVSWLVAIGMITCGICLLGMDRVNRKFLAENPESTGWLIRKSLVAILKASAALSPFIFLITFRYAPENTSLLLLAAVIIAGVFLAMAESLCAALVGIHHAKGYNLANLLQKTIVTLGYGIFFLAKQLSALTAIIGLSLGILVKLLTALKIIKNINSGTQPLAKEAQKEWKAYGKTQYSISLLSIFASHALILLMGVFNVTASHIGYYTVAFVFIESSLIIPRTLAMYLVPWLAQMDEKQHKIAISEISVLMLLLMSLGAAILYLLSGWLVPLLFGQEFFTSILLLKLLCIGLPAYGLVTVSQAIIAAIHSNRTNLMLAAILCVSIIISSTLLIPIFGVYGAIYSWIITAIITSLFSLPVIFRRKSTA